MAGISNATVAKPRDDFKIAKSLQEYWGEKLRNLSCIYRLAFLAFLLNSGRGLELCVGIKQIPVPSSSD
jgi:hypothetical protein